MSLRALHDLPAPAKLNLFLHITGRRPDGYHLLESVFVLIDWCDTLHIERRDDKVLRRLDLGALLPEDDLCLRAARALQAASGARWGADIAIEKRLPSGAGLGGGSSDAATVLLALNRLWGLHWPRERLLALAAGLGADVPFFVFGDNALAQGIGERLSRSDSALLDLPAGAAVAVLKPPASIPTASIFADPRLPRSTPSATISGFLERSALQALAEEPGGLGRNDLQGVAASVCADVAEALRHMRAHFGNARMTGSGSAVFSRIGNADLSKATWPAGFWPPDWTGRLCRVLPEHPLRRWAD